MFINEQITSMRAHVRSGLFQPLFGGLMGNVRTLFHTWMESGGATSYKITEHF